MFDIGWTEITVILIIVIIVIGPKELPGVLRTVGSLVGKAKAITSDFRSQLDEMIEDSELNEVKKQIETVGSLDPIEKLENEIDPNGELKDAFDFSGEDFASPVGSPTESSEGHAKQFVEDENKYEEDNSDPGASDEEFSRQKAEKSEKEVQA